MTQKELLYYEDAVSHEQILISVCEDMQENFEDEELKSFAEQEISTHTSIKERLLNLMEEKANE